MNPQRGFDFTVDANRLTPGTMTVGYYWSADGETKLPDVPSLRIRTLTDEDVRLIRRGDPLNEPVQFDVSNRPIGATHILVWIDPENNTPEGDEQNNVAALRIHEKSEVLQGKLKVSLVDPYTVSAVFRPGAGHPEGPFTLSEAEVVLGIDHFNWLQTITPPGNWVFQTYTDLTGREVATGQPIATLVNENVLKELGRIVDPVVTPQGQSRREYFIRRDPVDGKGDYRYRKVLSGLVATDAADFYLHDDSRREWSTYDEVDGGPKSATEFEFRDGPQFVDWLFAGSVVPSVAFETVLVGVKKSGESVTYGNSTKFTWRSNAVHKEGNDIPSGGGVILFAGHTAGLPAPYAGGIFDVRYDDGTPVPGFPTDAPPLPPLPPGVLGVATPQDFAVAAAGGTVRLLAPDRTERFSVAPFGADFAGEVRSAVADFNGDGVADLVAGTGPGRATRVVVLDGKDRHELFALDPFEASFTGGVFVAAGDVNGDGTPDLVVTPDEGGGPRVRVFSGNGFGQLADFLGIEDPDFRGGARPTLGDVNGDGRADLVIAAGFGGGPRVAAFDGTQLGPTGGPKLFGDFFAFEPGLANGVYVAAGDLDGDGFAEVVAGGGPGGGPRVAAFDGKTLARTSTPAPRADFFAGDANARGGVRVAVKDLDGDGMLDLVTGAGPGSAGRVAAYYGKNLPEVGFEFDAAPGRLDGVFVG
jgi:hypothetical protein